MENFVNHAAKYIIGVVVFFAMIALYFFVLADNTSSFDPKYVQNLTEENSKLSDSLKKSEELVADYKKQIEELNITLEQKEASIYELSNVQPLVADCDVVPTSTPESAGPTAEFVQVQNQLIEQQSKYITCSSNNEYLNDELRRLTALKASLEKDNSKSKTEITRINTALDEIEDFYLSLLTEFERTAPIRFTEFGVKPNFCDTDFGDDKIICVTSVEVDTLFNRPPKEQMTVVLTAPNGLEIGRKTFTSRLKNHIVFDILDDDSFLLGEYDVSFKINGLFSKNEQFEVDPALVNSL